MSERKTVRPGVREISPVSIYGEAYGGKDLRKRCVLSLEWKEEGVIIGDRGGDDSVDPTCAGYSEKVKDQDVDEAKIDLFCARQMKRDWIQYMIKKTKIKNMSTVQKQNNSPEWWNYTACVRVN